VTSYDYCYSGMPTEVPVGATLTFMNAGTEIHQIVVFRRNEGVTTSWQDLIATQQLFTQASYVGASTANPGEAGATTVVIDQPGDYLMVCLLDQGSVPATPAPEVTLAPSSPGTESPGASASTGASESPAASESAGASESPIGSESPSASESPAGSPGTPHYLLGEMLEFTATGTATESPSPSASTGTESASPSDVLPSESASASP